MLVYFPLVVCLAIWLQTLEMWFSICKCHPCCVKQLMGRRFHCELSGCKAIDLSLGELMPLLSEIVDASSNDISSRGLSDLNRAKASVLSAGFN